MANIRKNRVVLLRGVKWMTLNAYGVEYDSLVKLYDMLAHGEGLAQYVAVSEEDPSMVSYARVPDHRLDSKRRVKITLPKYLRRQLGISTDMFTDPYLNEVLAPNVLPGKCEVTLLQGDDLTDAYANQVGNHSCMCQAAKDGILSLYTMNPDKVKLAVFYRNNKPIMRALWWKTDSGQYYLDRIYFNGQVNVRVREFEQWAIAQGGSIRGTYNCCTGNYPNIDVYNLCVTLDNFPEIDGGYGWPYLDTFRYVEDCGNRVKLYSDVSRGSYIADNTDGYLKHEKLRCAECGDIIDDDDHYHNLSGDDICYECLGDYTSCCHCGELIDPDDVVTVDDDYYCQCCAERYACQCDDCSDWFSNRNIRGIGDYHYCQSCYSDHVSVCEDCSTDIHDDDVVTIHHNDYCAGCVEKLFFHCPNCGEYLDKGGEDITDIGENGVMWCIGCVDTWRGREFFGASVNAITGEDMD